MHHIEQPYSNRSPLHVYFVTKINVDTGKGFQGKFDSVEDTDDGPGAMRCEL